MRQVFRSVIDLTGEALKAACSVLGDLAVNDGLLVLRLALLRLALFLLAEIHGFALDDFALWSRNDGVFHVKEVAVDVEEDGRRRLDNARHQRVLDQLEVELLGRVIAESGVCVGQVQLEEVCAAESVGIDALWSQRVHVVIVTGMLAEEARSGGVVALRGDLELNHHLLALSGTAQEEGFLAVGALDIVLAPVLVQLDL